MSRLKSLLRVSDPSARNTQQTPENARKAAPVLDLDDVHDTEKAEHQRNTTQQGVQGVHAVAQHMHTTQQDLLHVARASPCNTQQTEELRHLVRLAGIHYAFTEDEHVLALEIAIGDPDAALICFRGIAARIGSGW